MSLRSTRWFAGLVAAVSAGCGAAPRAVGPAGSLSASAPRMGTIAAAGQPTVSLQAMSAAVRADAATAWPEVDSSALSVDAQSVTWPDGSMGCPQPGQFYTQALVAGWRLVVSDGRRELVYHASRRGAWVQCATPGRLGPLPGTTPR